MVLTLSERIIDELCEVVREGNFRYVAAQVAEVPNGTLSSWMHYGRKDIKEGRDSLQAKLVRRIEAAEGEAHRKLLEDVVRCDDPKVKLRFLELRYNKLYSRNPNAHFDDETGETVRTNAAELLREKLLLLLGDQ